MRRIFSAIGRAMVRMVTRPAAALGRQVARNHAHNAQQFPGQVRAIGRDAINDIRATIMEAYSGVPERAGVMGVPTSPTPGQVDRELRGGRGHGQRTLKSAIM